jgi:hypothetical protein
LAMQEEADCEMAKTWLKSNFMSKENFIYLI